MALLGPEGVNQVSRITPVTLDLRQIFIEATVAKELGYTTDKSCTRLQPCTKTNSSSL